MCRINPRVDFAFKKLFGSEENKDLLMGLINAIVAEEDQAADIELKNPYSLPAYQAGKMSVLDIRAVDKAGRWYNIEMQVSEDLHFDKRALYYWARLVAEQLGEGMIYRQLKKTVSINILDFNFTPSETEFHNLYKITNVTTGEDDRLHDIFELRLLDMKEGGKAGPAVSVTANGTVHLERLRGRGSDQPQRGRGGVHPQWLRWQAGGCAGGVEPEGGTFTSHEHPHHR